MDDPAEPEDLTIEIQTVSAAETLATDLGRTLSHDRWAQLGVAGLGVLLVLTVAGLPPVLVHAARLALAAGVVRTGLARIIHQEERRFWNGLACFFGGWMVAVLVPAVAPPATAALLLADAALAAAYLALIVAVERPIRRRRGLHAADLGLAADWPGGTAFVLGLFFYLSVVAGLATPEVYATGLLSSTLALVLGGYVTARLAQLSRHSETPRWRRLYGFLALGGVALTVSHGLELLSRRGGHGAPASDLATALSQTLPVLLLMLGARLRHCPSSVEPSFFDSVSRRDPLPWPRDRMMIFALLFPTLHLAASASGLLADDAGRGVREAFVLVWLLFFGALVIAQQRVLERRARSFWLERLRAEEALHRSHEHLRLAQDRATAEEALRKSEEKFDKAFRASPDAMLISTLAEGHILEVNDSFEQQFGYRREEVLGKTGVELRLWVEPEDRAMMTRLLRQQGQVRNLEIELTTKDGATRQTLLSCEILDLGGETCLLIAVRDVTELERGMAKGRPIGRPEGSKQRRRTSE